MMVITVRGDGTVGVSLVTTSLVLLALEEEEDHGKTVSGKAKADGIAFKVMNDEWQKEGEQTGLMRIKQTEYMSEGTHLKIYEEHPDVRSLFFLLPFCNSTPGPPPCRPADRYSSPSSPSPPYPKASPTPSPSPPSP